MSCGELGKGAKPEHTPEPWRVGRHGNDVVGSNGLGDTVAMMIDCDSDKQAHINARRIVACVNACAGIETFMLEMALENKRTIIQDLDDLTEQRDELLEALEGMAEIARLTIGWSCTPANADGPLAVAEKLIASVKGGAA